MPNEKRIFIEPKKEAVVAETDRPVRKRPVAPPAQHNQIEPWSVQDRVQAVTQFLLRLWGEPPEEEEHPLVRGALIAARGDRSMLTFTTKVAEIRYRVTSLNPEGIVEAALSSDDFVRILASASAAYARAKMRRSLRDVLALTESFGLPFFKEARGENIEIGGDSGGAVPIRHELRSPDTLGIDAGGETFDVRSASAVLAIPRRTILEEPADTVRAGLDRVLDAAIKAEIKAFFGLLDGNGNLNDGAPLFNAEAGNLLAGVPLSAEGLSRAVAALRNQRMLDGEPSDAPAAYLVVGSVDEMKARSLSVPARDGGLDLSVIASAFLSGSCWYLFADPHRYPAVARCTPVRPDGVSDDQSVSFEPADAVGHVESKLEFRHDVGFRPLSRIGSICATKRK